MKAMLLILYLLLGITYANADLQQDKNNNKKIESVREKESRTVDYLYKIDSLMEKNNQLEIKQKELEIQLVKLASTSTSNIDVAEKKDIDFEVWMGLLLACVAIVVTGLGVVIALAAIWGYANIKKKATKEALKQSHVQIKKAIAANQFEELIAKAVDRAIYRGILSDSDFPPPEPEGKSDES